MIVEQQKKTFQPITVVIETLVELEALQMLLGAASYAHMGSSKRFLRHHYNVLAGLYKELSSVVV